jgi:hypothetical protein
MAKSTAAWPLNAWYRLRNEWAVLALQKQQISLYNKLVLI